MNTKNQLIEHLEKNTRVLRTPEIKNAFEQIDRGDFVPEEYKEESYEDYPLPIGFSQTISQPTTVAFMLELLNVEPGNRVLDAGSGSGYTTALLAVLANEGSVLGIEIIPELAKMGQTNLSKYNFINAKIENKDAKSVSESFDRILVSAATEEIPENFFKILNPGGIMVVPVKQSIFRIVKSKDDKVDIREYPGFAFVPLK